MSTQATIILKLKNKDKNRELSSIINPNFKFRTENCDYIYTNITSDGMFSYTGKILLENYKTYENVLALISAGDQSILGEPFMEKYNAARWVDNQPQSIIDFSDTTYYTYIFKNNAWYILDGNDGKIKKLTKSMINE